MPRLKPFAVLVLAFASPAFASTAVESDMTSANPAGIWFFGGSKPLPPFEITGAAGINAEGPRPPEFPAFTADNHGAKFDGKGSRLVVADPGAGSRFDFAAGDAITIEAWVNPDSVANGANVYLIGKGRTWSNGMKVENQNWALRLLGRTGPSQISFLFQTKDSTGNVRNHRWVSQKTLTPGSGWHHVAVSYQFGKPDSMAGCIDGQESGGSWDHDGATIESPVPDDEPVWMGSSMGGKADSSLRGRLDAVAVYRSIIPMAMLKSRWLREPLKSEPPVFPAVLPPGKVLVELRPGAGDQKSWPAVPPPVTESYETAAFAFVRLPVAYDETGIRTDRPAAVMMRSYAAMDIPAGTHRMLLRGRGATRLWANGTMLGTTRFAVFRGDGHTPVDAIPDPPAEGARRVQFGDAETTVTLTSKGGRHEIVFDVLAGSKTMRAETGDSLAAIQFNGSGPFYILSPGPERIPLTEAAWPAFAAACEASLTERDTVRRRTLAESRAAYWQQRHSAAKAAAEAIKVSIPDKPGAPSVIDQFILAKVEATGKENAGASQGTVDFQRDIKPLLADRCYRCHGEKQKGGLSLNTRDAVLKGGESGNAAVIPGHANRSHLLTLVRSADEDKQMPPTGERLTEKQIQLLETWINEGAVWRNGPAGPVTIPPDAGDAAFVRRAYLSTTGVAPGADETRAFLENASPAKRARLIDRLLDDPRFAEHWVSYWQDVLAENPNILKPELNNSGPFRFWIHESLLDHKPLDRFVTELILMRGSKLGGGPAGFGMASQNDVPLAEKANILANAFLGVEMKCARCHDSPYHSTTQRQLFQMAALLEEKPLKIPASSSVPAAFFEKTKTRQPLIKATLHAGAVIDGEWPFEALCGTAPPPEPAISPRERLAWSITGPHNLRFAEVLANRVWQRLFGMGLMHPVHDWEGRVPSHPELLKWLGRELMASDYDLRHLCRVIMNSAAWQRRAAEMPDASDPARRFFTAPLPRRMSAEQIVDTLHAAAGRPIDAEMLTFDIDSSQRPETMLNLGTARRAWEFTSLANERDRPALALPHAQTVTDMLEAFGWRPSRPEPLTERPVECTALQPAMLANGTLAAGLFTLSEPSRFTAMACQEQPLPALVDSLWLHLLNRPPTSAEKAEALTQLTDGYDARLTGRPAAAPSNEDPDLTYRRISWSNHLRPEATEIKQRVTRAVLRGPAPTTRLTAAWRERCEDLIWSIVNSPEFLTVP
ncbi:MAG TPA: DUF1553 domain-containing protein [Verrucomicrobiales bacterium]|nr:DUF1553 domain-containing protein [Verrucomicrobiales bacterium]